METIKRLLEGSGYKRYSLSLPYKFEKGLFIYTVLGWEVAIKNGIEHYQIRLSREDKITRIFYDTIKETFEAMSL